MDILGPFARKFDRREIADVVAPRIKMRVGLLVCTGLAAGLLVTAAGCSKQSTSAAAPRAA